MENVHEFRISRYKDNSENIKLAEEYFGKLRNKYDMPVLNVVDRGEHLVPPDKPVPDAYPEECTCKAYAMVGDVIDYCGPARTIANKLGRGMIKAEKIDKKNFLDGIGDFIIRDITIEGININKVFGDILLESDYCDMCISNAKVAKLLKKAEA